MTEDLGGFGLDGCPRIDGTARSHRLAAAEHAQQIPYPASSDRERDHGHEQTDGESHPHGVLLESVVEPSDQGPQLADSPISQAPTYPMSLRGVSSPGPGLAATFCDDAIAAVTHGPSALLEAL